MLASFEAFMEKSSEQFSVPWIICGGIHNVVAQKFVEEPSEAFLDSKYKQLKQNRTSKISKKIVSWIPEGILE